MVAPDPELYVSLSLALAPWPAERSAKSIMIWREEKEHNARLSRQDTEEEEGRDATQMPESKPWAVFRAEENNTERGGRDSGRLESSHPTR